jgi:N-acetylmuramoyl-L-alanine amidase
MRSSGSPVDAGFRRMIGVAILLAITAVAGLHSQSTDPSALFQQALRRETLLRQELEGARGGAPGGVLLERIRVLVGSYEDLARLFAKSDSTDDSLSHGGMLAADAYVKFGEAIDRDAALRLLRSLSARFPASPLAKQATTRLRALESGRPVPPVTAVAAAPAPVPASAPLPAAAPPPPGPAAAAPRPAPPSAAVAPSGPVTLRAIRREVLAETLRVTLELDREVWFYDERLEGPSRVFVDLSNTRAAEDLKDATIPFRDGVVKQIRVGRQLNSRTRVVLDLNGAGSHSVYTMYNPFRIVIDLQRIGSAPAAAAVPLPARPPAPSSARAPVVHAATVSTSSSPLVPPPAPRETAGEARRAPTAPPQNSNGSFSLARQLGLGVARVVIDPGHGGHDPGARGNGISEAALVLDVATRLEALLKKQNVEVVLTRRGDTYVTLEERTALANKSDADLFLSIHANTNTVQSVRGVETYFLNFASNPEAEAIAARENAGSARSMRHLPDIVQAIAMNNKLDESRDFATIVQSTLYTQLRQTNKTLKNLGVKQAPFMVLVNARMPSVLAEVSFMSNRAEATLLKTERYKQQIAEALSSGIMRYQSALKRAAPARAE